MHDDVNTPLEPCTCWPYALRVRRSNSLSENPAAPRLRLRAPGKPGLARPPETLRPQHPSRDARQMSTPTTSPSFYASRNCPITRENDPPLRRRNVIATLLRLPEPVAAPSPPRGNYLSPSRPLRDLATSPVPRYRASPAHAPPRTPASNVRACVGPAPRQQGYPGPPSGSCEATQPRGQPIKATTFYPRPTSKCASRLQRYPSALPRGL